MSNNLFFKYLIGTMLFAISVGITSCQQSDPEDVLGRQGDIVNFSGRKWDVKYSKTPVGPGPNYFSQFYDDVWVDEKGYLHLTIANHDGIWYSSEVISQENMGYGTYVFTIQADISSFARNVVFGLFTWDESTFYEEANSEVGIEFSRWDDAETTKLLTMSVQPVNFGTFYPERTHTADVEQEVLSGVSTHMFTWTDTLITWASYTGENYTSATPIATWDFDLNHPPRIKKEGGQSSLPVVIPAPGNNTNARINLWTLPFVAIGPENGLQHEVVIRKFEYFPAE